MTIAPPTPAPIPPFSPFHESSSLLLGRQQQQNPPPAQQPPAQQPPAQQPGGNGGNGGQQQGGNGNQQGGNGNQQGGNQQGGNQQGGNQQGGNQQGGNQQGGNQQGGNQQGGNGNQNAATSSTSQINIPQTAPAGGILMTQPPQTAAASFYKIAPSQLITFGWNLTSLSITPSALSVSAFCSANGNTYPVGPTNGVIPGTATQVVWDVFSYQQANPTQPLIVASYTLQIVDAHGLTQIPAPGRFAPFEGMTFGLYSTQAYTPLASWTCAGCSSATSSTHAQPLAFAILATFIAMLFGGWNILRRT